MKAVILALAVLAGSLFSAQAGTARQLFQAPAAAPSNCPTVFEVAQQNGLTTLVQALTLDDLADSLNDTANNDLAYTVFAPTNEAFENALTVLGRTDLQDVLFNSELDDILQYHFIIQPYTEAELVSLGTVQTNDRNQTIDVLPDGTIVGFASNATIITPNVPACQTIIHIIDNVLLPAAVPNFNGGPYVAPPAAAPSTSSS